MLFDLSWGWTLDAEKRKKKERETWVLHKTIDGVHFDLIYNVCKFGLCLWNVKMLAKDLRNDFILTEF